MEKKTSQTEGIAKSAGSVSVAVMASRLLGLVREQAFAYLFGAGFAFDAFVVAFRIPNLLRDLFGEGALSAAFVAVFSDYDENRGERESFRLASNVLTFFAVILSVLVLLGILFSDQLVRFLVEADFESIPGKLELTRLLTVIMFPFLVLVSLASVVMGILNTKGVFFLPALSSSFFNLGSLVVGVGLSLIMPRFGQPAIVGMAVGTLAGGVLQLAGQLPKLFRLGYRYVPVFDPADPGLRRVLRLMVPAVVGLAPLQINVLINTYFASSLAEGSLSWLNYAFRIFWLPVGLFGVALSVAIMPVVSRQAARGEMRQLTETLVSSLTMAFALTIPASIGLMLLGEPVVRLIFEHGRFDPMTTVRTADALRFYSLGLAAYAAVKIMVPVFYALDAPRYPVMGSFLTMAVNLVIILIAIDHLEFRALALSISGAMAVNCLFLGALLYRKSGGFAVGRLARGVGKVALATLVMGTLTWILRLQVLDRIPRLLWLELFGTVGVIVASALAYAVVLHWLRLPELRELWSVLAARLGLSGKTK